MDFTGYLMKRLNTDPVCPRGMPFGWMTGQAMLLINTLGFNSLITIPEKQRLGYLSAGKELIFWISMSKAKSMNI